MKFILHIGSKSIPQIERELSRIPDDDRDSLAVTIEIGNRTVADMAGIVNMLRVRRPLSELGLTRIDSKSEEELTQIFKTVPASVRLIRVSYEEQSPEVVSRLLHLRPNLNSLALCANSSRRFNDKWVRDLLALMPHGITSLGLADLQTLLTAQTMRIFSTIPETVTSLIIEECDFNEMSPEELLQIASNIPSSVTSLCINSSFLNKEEEEVEQIFASIHKEVSSIELVLSLSDLREGNIENLISKLKYLPPNITTLILSSNDEGIFNRGLDQLLAAIPDNITTLKVLSRGWYIPLTADELVPLLALVPAGVESVDIDCISYQHLVKTGGTEGLLRVVEALPKVTSIKIAGISLSRVYASGLLEHVHALVQKNTFEFHVTTIPTSERIFDAVLTDLIGIINTPGIANPSLASLTAGILLIEMAERSSDEEGAHYDLQRILDSIPLLKRAALDDIYKPFAEFMLWHLKTVHADNPEIMVKLDSISVRPPECIISTYSLFKQEKPNEDPQAGSSHDAGTNLSKGR